ncbi:MAG TPA: hypothetical protein VGD87_07215 [Archangium sp.]
MSRSLLVGSICSLAILSGFAACGKPPVACDGDSLVDQAQLCPDRASLGFAQEFGSGTRIGTRPINTLSMRNGGLTDLTINGASLSGDPAFKLTTVPSALPATIHGNKSFLAQIEFAPTEARLYTAKLIVESNAANTPTREFEISGCGIPTDGGSSPCYRADAGTP